MSDSEKKKAIRPKSDRKAPTDMDAFFQWQTNRRSLLKAALIAGTLSQFSFLQSCTDDLELEKGNELLDSNQMTILKSALNILFPDDGNGPSIESLNTLNYIVWVLKDSGANPTHQTYLMEGIDWADEMAFEKSAKKYIELDQQERERAIRYYTETEYGKEWCSIMMTLILESLLLDPIYGANVNEAGWKWLDHTPGYPRPDESNRYENVLTTARNAYPKSSV
jgi:gluconate 2-dehydrogenase gamma chain